MSVRRDLADMLAHLDPELCVTPYVFVTQRQLTKECWEQGNCVAMCREPEGWTLVLPKDRAEAMGMSFDGVYRRITLQVHSSLAAVGLTAAVSTRLSQDGISVNMIAGYFHDHLFVPDSRAEEALNLLRSMEAADGVADDQ